jgi:2-methylcitrate dehydratase PrpD
VKVEAESDLDRYFPQSWPGRVRVQLEDGTSHTNEIIVPKGETGHPMPRREVEEKFISLAAPIIGDERAGSVVREVECLEQRESLRSLLSALGA